jgi:hypothetical protein
VAVHRDIRRLAVVADRSDVTVRAGLTFSSTRCVDVPFPGGPGHELNEPLLDMLLTGSRSLRLPRSSCMRITREPGRPGESRRAGGGGDADCVCPRRRPGRRLAPLPADEPDGGPFGCLSPSVPGSPQRWPRQRSARAVSLRPTPARCPARSRISPVLRSARQRPAACPAGARQGRGCAACSSTPGHTAPPARRLSRSRGWPGRPEVRAGSTRTAQRPGGPAWHWLATPRPVRTCREGERPRQEERPPQGEGPRQGESPLPGETEIPARGAGLNQGRA